MADEQTPEVEETAATSDDVSVEETADAAVEETVDAAEAETAATSDDVAVEETADAVSSEAADSPEAESETETAPAVSATPKDIKAARRAERGQRRSSSQEERDAERKAKRAARSRTRKNRRERDNKKRQEAGPKKTVSTVEHGPGAPKERVGIVVSDKADKTITVRIDTARRHRRYQKIVRSSSTLHAHDETNDAKAGDRVRVIESRPLSATKRWRLTEVLERAK